MIIAFISNYVSVGINLCVCVCVGGGGGGAIASSGETSTPHPDWILYQYFSGMFDNFKNCCSIALSCSRMSPG